MTFLEEMALGIDCTTCPEPHGICDFTLCPTCRDCPVAKQRQAELATERLAYQRSTVSAKARGW